MPISDVIIFSARKSLLTSLRYSNSNWKYQTELVPVAGQYDTTDATQVRSPLANQWRWVVYSRFSVSALTAVKLKIVEIK